MGSDKRSFFAEAIMAVDQDDFYQERILDHYEAPFHRGHCNSPTHRHRDKNPLCGDIIQIELSLDDQGKIRDVYFDGDGCCISQASASMLLETLDGKTVDEIKQFSAEDMLELFGTRLTPNRQKCCLLPWRVLQSTLHSPIDTTADGDCNCQGARKTERWESQPLAEGH
jgi:nitrogen fixation NifU-like protein